MDVSQRSYIEFNLIFNVMQLRLIVLSLYIFYLTT